MRAIVTLTMWSEVDDHDHAAELAADAESGVRLNMASLLEQNGVTEEEMSTRMGILGVSYWLLPEEE